MSDSILLPYRGPRGVFLSWLDLRQATLPSSFIRQILDLSALLSAAAWFSGVVISVGSHLIGSFGWVALSYTLFFLYYLNLLLKSRESLLGAMLGLIWRVYIFGVMWVIGWSDWVVVGSGARVGAQGTTGNVCAVEGYRPGKGVFSKLVLGRYRGSYWSSL